MPRTLAERIGRGNHPFKGLSDKSRPDALTVGECCDLQNADFFEDAAGVRGGIVRKAGPLREGSIRLDGVNDYLRIATQSAYRVTAGTTGIYIGIGVVLRTKPASTVTLLSWGFGAAADLFWDIRYDPTGGGSSLGAWIFRVRDATAGATRTVTLDDGDATGSPVGKYRFVEAFANNNDVGFEIYDGDGTLITSNTTTGATTLNPSSSQDLFIGVGTTAANTIGSDFINATIAELRYATYANAIIGVVPTAGNNYSIRELTAAAKALTLGYWQFNDGDDDGVCTDSSGASPQNDAVIVNEPPPWVLAADQPLVLGTAAVKFKGGNEWLDVRDTTAGSPTTVASVFTSSGGAVAAWTFRCIYIPALPPGVATIPDGVLLWMGADLTLPAPLAIRVVSDNIEVTYNDNGTARTTTVPGVFSLSALVGKRIRISVAMRRSPSALLHLELTYPTTSSPFINTVGTASSYTPSASGPTTISQDWALGRHVTNFGTARLGSVAAFHTDGPLLGVLDDVQLLAGFKLSPPVSVSVTEPFEEHPTFPGIATALYLRLNDGAGTGPLAAEGFQQVTNGGWQAYLRPAADTGATWDIGLVDPQTPKRASLFRAFDRFSNDRKTRRDALIACGTTLYAYDIIADVLRIIGPLPARSDVWTFAQYGQRGLLAGAPGRRPIWTDGNGVYNLGIEPPQAQAIVAVSNAAGTFTAGAYYLYVTFENKGKPFTRSNPSPGTIVTFAGANDTIDSVQLPVSNDPQVNRRRIWMTALGGADGDVAYLVATIDDNTTTSYTTDILSVSTSSESISNFFNQAAAPAGTIIAQFKDYTLIGGPQDFPTRLYFSQPSVPDYWLPIDSTGVGGDWEDLDLDAGRPITAIKSLLNAALVDFSDGRAVVTLTGDPNDPLTFAFTERSTGAVGPQAIVTDGNLAYFIGENSISVTTGYDQTNLSGPGERQLDAPKFLQDAERPSISRTILRKIIGTDRRRFVAVLHRSKSQVWFAVSTAANQPSNDTTLIYDIERRIWSKNDIPIDCADQIDDSTGSARLWGVSNGYVCLLDEPTQPVDGFASFVSVGTVASVSGKTIGITGLLDAAGKTRFLQCYVLAAATGQLVKFQIRDNPDTSNIIAADTATLTGIAAGDQFLVGGIAFWLEFAFRFGATVDKKRMRWLRAYGECTVDPTYLRVAYKVDENRYDQAITAWTNEIRQWPVGTPDLQVNVGGLGGLLRVRLGPQPLASGTPTEWMPSLGTIKIAALELLADAVDVI